MTYPLQEESLFKLLMKIGMKNSNFTIVTEDYRKLINELYKTFNVKVRDPDKVKRIILADDDATCQLTVKTIIERSGDYEVLSFFNGLEVLLYKIIGI